MNGIPNVAGLVSALSTTLVSFGGAVLVNAVFGKQWGIVNQYGIPILLARSVLGMAYDNSSSISSLPVEGGSFASYNKVDNPAIATVQMTTTESVLKRGAFLTQLETLKRSTLSFYIISPEYVYQNYQIIGINYSREAGAGCTLITVNVELQEVREAKVEYSYEEVKNPEDAKTKDGGQKQPEQKTSVLFDAIGKVLK